MTDWKKPLVGYRILTELHVSVTILPKCLYLTNNNGFPNFEPVPGLVSWWNMYSSLLLGVVVVTCQLFSHSLYPLLTWCLFDANNDYTSLNEHHAMWKKT